MVGDDPHRRVESVYECVDCSVQFRTDGRYTSCGVCGGAVRNIGIPRE